MSDPLHPYDQAPHAANPGTPHRTPPPPPPRPRSPVLSCLFSLSLLVNFGIVLAAILLCANFLRYDADADVPLSETYFSGSKSASNKIAIIHLDGVIMEGLLRYPHRQIETAAKDNDVKAVVFRIDSPGGSITASDDLHHRLVELRDGNSVKKYNPKPIVVSMGSMAASGGYYVAMPGQTIVAERTTLTGSVGVYAAFPTVAGLAKKYEFGLVTIKQGEIKDSGSPFKEMTDKERQVWQDMVDHAYNQFLEVVAAGRKDRLTKEQLLEPVDITPVNAAPARLGPPAPPYQRYRADGGVYTSDMALKLKLVDQIGYLDDAVKLAEQAAGGGEFKVIQYERPISLREVLVGGQTAQPSNSILDPGTLRKGMTPRLWYLAPGCEVAGVLSAMEEKR
jgi:protease IV